VTWQRGKRVDHGSILTSSCKARVGCSEYVACVTACPRADLPRDGGSPSPHGAYVQIRDGLYPSAASSGRLYLACLCYGGTSCAGTGACTDECAHHVDPAFGPIGFGCG
jgi:hypothetical protein